MLRIPELVNARVRLNPTGHTVKSMCSTTPTPSCSRYAQFHRPWGVMTIRFYQSYMEMPDPDPLLRLIISHLTFFCSLLNTLAVPHCSHCSYLFIPLSLLHSHLSQDFIPGTWREQPCVQDKLLIVTEAFHNQARPAFPPSH